MENLIKVDNLREFKLALENNFDHIVLEGQLEDKINDILNIEDCDLAETLTNNILPSLSTITNVFGSFGLYVLMKLASRDYNLKEHDTYGVMFKRA